MSDARVALVTGGGRGIGRAISLGLAADGCDVAVNYRRDREAAEETVAEIEKIGRRAVAYGASVDDGEATDRMVGQIIDALGPIGILVNNAGIASRGQSVRDTDPAELQRVMAVHALGPHRICQAVLPSMRTVDRGDIVFISSVATLHHGALGGPYSMGKAAMESLALTLAKEERPNGIHVNIVAPGLVDTTMGQKLVKATAGVEDIRTLDQHSPFGRVCTPDDVAGVVRYFCSDAAGYLTGQKVNVHGGG
jgi:NAD(P)-dependent dehydrogenase (short-subunit alcohol dehydrogenase family)